VIPQACQKRVAEDTTGEAHCTGQVRFLSILPNVLVITHRVIPCYVAVF
jgi:hypothetical protein